MTVLEEIQKAEEMAIRTKAEAERLQADLASLRQKLGLDAGTAPLLSTGSGSSVSAVKPKRAKRNGNGSSKKRGRGRPAGSGQRPQQFLDAVRSTPGISVAQIGENLGVDPTGLYRYAKKFEAEGAIRKDGQQLFPVEAAVPASDPEHIPT